MRVLVIGSGGREHALCLALSLDPAVTALSCAPGNAGTGLIAPRPTSGPEWAGPLRPKTGPQQEEPAELPVESPEQIASTALAWAADLVVIGPEAPLVAGAADAVRAAGIDCFGPSMAAAALEGSKTFAKEVMLAAGVPTAEAITATTTAAVEAALDTFGAPYVVKDDGLAAGKGVVVTEDRDAAAAHAEAILSLGRAVVVEAYLDGPEVSLFGVTDGTTVLPLIPVQDFKRIADGDTGPNTGGMGAYAPLPWAPAHLVDTVSATVLQPTIDEMARRGVPFVGLLYAGLALTRRGVRVVEFNARFGDPETQVVLPLLATPLGGLLRAAASGGLGRHDPLRWHSGAAVTVVVAAPGYPAVPRTGQIVGGADGVDVRHAGTRRDGNGQVLSSGGRVVSVVGTGPDLETARNAAYDAVGTIALEGGQYRNDIASAAVEGRISAPDLV